MSNKAIAAIIEDQWSVPSMSDSKYFANLNACTLAE